MLYVVYGLTYGSSKRHSHFFQDIILRAPSCDQTTNLYLTQYCLSTCSSSCPINGDCIDWWWRCPTKISRRVGLMAAIWVVCLGGFDCGLLWFTSFSLSFLVCSLVGVILWWVEVKVRVFGIICLWDGFWLWIRCWCCSVDSSSLMRVACFWYSTIRAECTCIIDMNF